VLHNPLDGLSLVFVGFLGYPTEVTYHGIFNILVGFSLDPILILNFQDFFVGSSGNGCSMKKIGVPLSFL
jgi:hypothetical protein